jgi:CubicO group peptidase (beta-lactamase class C family)
MKIRKFLFRGFLLIIVLALASVIYYLCNALPIANGFGAKLLCSAVFVAGRQPEDVMRQDLSSWPFNIQRFSVDLNDSSTTSSVLGLFKRKAIFRKGLGATLISELTEKDIRSQTIVRPVEPPAGLDSVYWPMGDRLKDSFPAEIDRSKLESAMDYVFAEPDSTHPVRTRAVVVLYNGEIVGERYAPGFNRNSRLLGWSMTKSITGALTGILIKRGLLKVNDPAPVPEWKDPADPRHAITLKDLLQQCSGLKFVEDYTHPSDATRMLGRRADMGGYTASHRLRNTPGTDFYYSSGNSNILARIIRQRLSSSEYYRFPYEQLFYKCGMYSMILEPDASGTFVGSSYSYATARDWARFGLLYINDGVFNNERILPEGWVKESVEPAAAAEKGEYGFQLWLNAGQKNKPANRMFPSAPTDMFYAAGYEGQHVFVIPSRKLVIVRLGLTQGKRYDADGFLARTLAALRGR